jgi:hypothetical protein
MLQNGRMVDQQNNVSQRGFKLDGCLNENYHSINEDGKNN